jgi:nicotinamide mononucleotide transporter
MVSINEWWLILKQQFYQISYLEAIGVVFGVAEVFLAKNNKVWLYPCGLINILVTMYIYLDIRLYAEILLQGYYFVMSLYGWFIWASKKNNTNHVSLCTTKDRLIACFIVIFSWILLYFFLTKYTNSDVPVWDSLVSAFAWAGMWLLAKRKLDNWIFLNISNFISVPLLIHKGLILYSILTIFLFIIAIFGYLDWKKLVPLQNLKLKNNP